MSVLVSVVLTSVEMPWVLFLSKGHYWSAWVAQFVECLILGFIPGHGLGGDEIGP